MDGWKNKKGISLVSLVVTIIVLIILSGVVIILNNSGIIEKTVLAATKTEEGILEEQIEMAWVETKATHILSTENFEDSVLEENFQKELEKNLKEVYQFENVNVSVRDDSSMHITFTYKDEIYDFLVSSNGKASLDSKEKVEINKPLKGNVKVGDYIEYPIEYFDVYEGKKYTSTNGWRIIDDGVMEGTSGYVKIISTGVPAKFDYYHKDREEIMDNLLNHFEEIDLLDNSNTGIRVKGKKFKVDEIAEKVTTLTLSDFNCAYNVLYHTNRKLDDTSSFDDKYQLFHLRDTKMFTYLLVTNEAEKNDGMYYMTNSGINFMEMILELV